MKIIILALVMWGLTLSGFYAEYAHGVEWAGLIAVHWLWVIGLVAAVGAFGDQEKLAKKRKEQSKELLIILRALMMCCLFVIAFMGWELTAAIVGSLAILAWVQRWEYENREG